MKSQAKLVHYAPLLLVVQYLRCFRRLHSYNEAKDVPHFYKWGWYI